MKEQTNRETSFNSYRKKRKEFLEEVIRRYEQQLGEKMSLQSRRQEEVIHRMAISNASRPFCTTMMIGSVLSKDHSSIVHYHKEHKPMLMHSAYYREQFRTALRIVDESSSDMNIQPAVLGRTGPNLDGQIEIISEIILDLEKVLDTLLENKKKSRQIWKDALEDIALQPESAYRQGRRKFPDDI